MRRGKEEEGANGATETTEQDGRRGRTEGKAHCDGKHRVEQRADIQHGVAVDVGRTGVAVGGPIGACVDADVCGVDLGVSFRVRHGLHLVGACVDRDGPWRGGADDQAAGVRVVGDVAGGACGVAVCRRAGRRDWAQVRGDVLRHAVYCRGGAAVHDDVVWRNGCGQTCHGARRGRRLALRPAVHLGVVAKQVPGPAGHGELSGDHGRTACCVCSGCGCHRRQRRRRCRRRLRVADHCAVVAGAMSRSVLLDPLPPGHAALPDHEGPLR